MEYILFTIIIIFLIFKIIQSKKRPSVPEHIPEIPTTNAEPDLTQYSGKYKRKYLLTLNEKEQYLKIKSVTDKLGLHLFAKVRLADIIEPIPGQKNWKSLWYKIQAKHVDFFICKPTMASLCALEIDDSSHNQANRKQRDEFVDFILKDSQIPIIRKNYIQCEELEKQLLELLNN